MEGVATHELVYLKKDSLDAVNQLLVVKDSYDILRQVPLTKRCVELFQSAVSQTNYIINNGDNLSLQSTVKLRDSDYLIKVSLKDFITNQSLITEIDSVLLRTIYMRLKRLAALYSTPELTHLTTVKLQLQEMAYVN
jgi:hypothetical protein